jgi:hypothetical protein
VMLSPGVAMSKLRSRFNIGIVRSLVVCGGGRDIIIKVCHEFVINIGMCFEGSLVREGFKRPAFIRL